MIKAAARRLGRGNTTWPRRHDMYTVAEGHDDDDDDDDEDLADFGLNGTYREPLLRGGGWGDDQEDDVDVDVDVDVDEMMNNPMAASIMPPSSSSSSSSRRKIPPPRPRQRVEVVDDDCDAADETFGAFVLLRRLRILPKNDGYAYVSDLDAFFSSLYNYYYMRGLGSIIGRGLVEIVSLFFTLWLSIVMFAYIDWEGLRGCHDEGTCRESFVESYVIKNPFSSGSYSMLRNSWIVIYCLLFSAYGSFCVIQYFHSIIASLECKVFLDEVLGVTDRDLEVGAVEWGDIVERMSEAQRIGKCRVAILPWMADAAIVDRSQRSTSDRTGGDVRDDPTGHLVVAQRIMRRENYMIAFFNLGLLDVTLPRLPSRMWPLTILTNRSADDRPVFFSKSIEWSVYFCVLNYMFNHSRRVRPAFYGDPSSLRRRFVLCGVAHAIFMPFLLFFVTLHFFMSNVYEFQSTKEYLGPREWSSLARWTFREYNELPHSFEKRMEPSYKSASDYLDLFGRPSPFKVALARLLVFVSGSLGTLLLAFATMNDAILLHVKIGDWNLLWYAGMLGACFSVGKGMLPKSTNPYFGHARRNLISDMNLELEKLATYTHFLPDAWRGRAADSRTKMTFSSMFKFKASLFVDEVLSIMAAPIILCVSLPQCADKLCEFVRDSKVEVPSLGDVVGYSTFDFDSFEDENWTGKSLDQSSKLSIRDTGERLFKTSDRPKSRHGKMEKSFFNFKGVYPNWKMPESGRNLVEKIESYRKHQNIALVRERRLHIAAAAAQLETLRRLEIDREKRASAGLSGFVDDRHIRSVSSGPDSGGGEARGANLSHHSDDGISDDESFGSLPHDGFYHQHAHFEELTHSSAPPMYAFAHSSANFGPNIGDYHRKASSPIRFMANSSHVKESVMHYADPGLSMDLRELLNASTLYDPSASQQSFTGSLIPMDDKSASILDVRSDQQVTAIIPLPTLFLLL
jgi:autophagy-related protein 9